MTEPESLMTLRDVRIKRGLSLRALSDLSGVALTTLNRIELDHAGVGGKKRMPQLDIVRRLSLALDINPFTVRELNDAIMTKSRSQEAKDTRRKENTE